MEAFDVLGDPVRRRILELLAEGEASAGELTAVATEEFGISQPAVSRHLRVLRESGFARQRAEGARRLYALDGRGLEEARSWIAGLERFWGSALDALETEVARQHRDQRTRSRPEPARTHPSSPDGPPTEEPA